MLKTPLHANHIALGAKMGEFAGYDMPLYYREGVIKEHEWVRSSAGLFDVSHMGQGMVKGPGALEFVEKLTPSSFAKLPGGMTKYTVLTNPQGGIIDDLMITHCGENMFNFVLNAGCKNKDIAWIRKNLTGGLEFIYHGDEWALLALQGPESEKVMKDVLGFDLSDMPYMGMRPENDFTMFISRLGYTGEDGFEIAVKNEEAPALWEKFLAHAAVKPVGLAARDSLRLEMGYPLYGHDIDETTTPVEAGLDWIVRKDIHFPPPQRLRVGLKLTDKGIAREGAEIRNEVGEKIGVLTSGGFSPTLKESIGMGYIEKEMAKTGTKIFVHVRGRDIPAEISALPFVPAKTKMKKKKAA